MGLSTFTSEEFMNFVGYLAIAHFLRLAQFFNVLGKQRLPPSHRNAIGLGDSDSERQRQTKGSDCCYGVSGMSIYIYITWIIYILDVHLYHVGAMVYLFVMCI